jgi:hypothetical protein
VLEATLGARPVVGRLGTLVERFASAIPSRGAR